MLGIAVQKLYEKTIFYGKITSTFTEKKNQITHWNVLYSDGDSSDYNVTELAPLLDTKKNPEKSCNCRRHFPKPLNKTKKKPRKTKRKPRTLCTTKNR
jgi:hypothetical protein